MRNALLGIFAIAISIAPAFAEGRGARFQNLDQMIEDLNLRAYFQSGIQSPKRNLKVAVFDNGFKGASAEIGRGLPETTFIHKGPVKLQGEEETHGYYMAKIFYDLITLGGKDSRYAPVELHLYNTFGYSNFKAAVEGVIAENIDIVLYSQTWEYGGNFDGNGFINKLVDKALDRGILWVNNAGNFGNSTFNSQIRNGRDDWVDLPGANSSVEVRCEENPTGRCLMRSVLSWNDFSDDVNEGTDKDLDFVLTDDTLSILQTASLTQSKQEDKPGSSKYPREILSAELKPGLYFLRVKNRSKNFSGQDQLRITLSGDFMSMKGFDKEESLLVPADNARVLTVGALDSEKSSQSTRLQKPELFTNSLITLSRKEQFKGTSNSAAMVAAGAAILLSLDPSLTKDSLLDLLHRSPATPSHSVGQGLPLEQLGFYPTDARGCFLPLPSNIGYQYPFLSPYLQQGGVLVETSAGWKMLFPFDPIPLLRGYMRRLPNDILVAGPYGPGMYHRSMQGSLPQGAIELVEIPWGQAICGSSQGDEHPAPFGVRFRMPNPEAFY